MMAHYLYRVLYGVIYLDNNLGTFVSNNLNYFNDNGKLYLAFSFQEDH
jgi:hypothetical protein